MTEKQPPRAYILPSDIDSQGNVVIWDNGHDGMAQPLTMSASDAGHAMAVEPGRYTLEPDDIDEAEVARRVEEMREKRRAAAEFAQNVIDRKVAIAEIMSERKAEAMAAEVEHEAPRAEIESDRAVHDDAPKPVGKPLMKPGDDLDV